MECIPLLPRARRREILRLGKKSKDRETYLRFLMIYKITSSEKPSRQRVAREIGVVVSTVVRTAHRYRAEGVAGLYDRRKHNGERKIDDKFCFMLALLLRGSPEDCGWERPTWTRELFCLEMQRRGFPLVAHCTMGRVLRACDARLKRPRPVVNCPWPAEQREWRRMDLQDLADHATAEEPVFYSDEVDIHLNPKIGRDWMLRGHQKLVVTPGKNEKRYLAGALDIRTGKLTWIEGASKTSHLFCQLLWKLVGQYRRAKRLHIILDNYIIHSSKITRRCVEQFNGRVVLHFLPPYCPNYNRIERSWQDLHANVTRNHRCQTMRQLMSKVGKFLERYRYRVKEKMIIRFVVILAA